MRISHRRGDRNWGQSQLQGGGAPGVCVCFFSVQCYILALCDGCSAFALNTITFLRFGSLPNPNRIPASTMRFFPSPLFPANLAPLLPWPSVSATADVWHPSLSNGDPAQDSGGSAARRSMPAPHRPQRYRSDVMCCLGKSQKTDS